MGVETRRQMAGVIEESDYVRMDPDASETLFPDTIRLYIKSSGKAVMIRQTPFQAGRGMDCELYLESSNITRKQITFFYENGTWYIRDNYSKNGTWLNGMKMQPGKKYQLYMDDVIDFAHSEKIVFFKSK